MAEGKQSDLNNNEQQYVFAKIMLNNYGILHEYFIAQMKFYTIACCNISLPGEFETVLAERKILYKIRTEKAFKVNGKKKNKLESAIYMMPAKYNAEREIAARNLREWTRKLLSWDDAEIKVEIDGTEQQ